MVTPPFSPKRTQEVVSRTVKLARKLNMNSDRNLWGRFSSRFQSARVSKAYYSTSFKG
jgi:hypothetical protein